MIEDDWKILMKALSIRAQAVHFSKGTTQREKDAIADHMIGIADMIQAYPVPTFIKCLSESQALLVLQVADLQEIEVAARAVDAQWKRSCTYDTPEILALRALLTDKPKARPCSSGKGTLCVKPYAATEDTYGMCGNELGHDGACGRAK